MRLDLVQRLDIRLLLVDPEGLGSRSVHLVGVLMLKWGSEKRGSLHISTGKTVLLHGHLYAVSPYYPLQASSTALWHSSTV